MVWCEAAGGKVNCEENSIVQVTLTEAMPKTPRENNKKGKIWLLSRGESEEEEREKIKFQVSNLRGQKDGGAFKQNEKEHALGKIQDIHSDGHNFSQGTKRWEHLLREKSRVFIQMSCGEQWKLGKVINENGEGSWPKNSQSY